VRRACKQIILQISEAGKDALHQIESRKLEDNMKFKEQVETLERAFNLMIKKRRRQRQFDLLEKEGEILYALERQQEQALASLQLKTSAALNTINRKLLGKRDNYEEKKMELEKSLKRLRNCMLEREEKLEEAYHATAELKQAFEQKYEGCRIGENQMKKLSDVRRVLKSEILELQARLKGILKTSVQQRKNVQPAYDIAENIKRETAKMQITLAGKESILQSERSNVQNLEIQLRSIKKLNESKREMLQTRSSEINSTMLETERDMEERQAMVDQLHEILRPYKQTVGQQAAKLKEWRNSICESEQRVKQKEVEIETREEKLATYCQSFEVSKR